MRQSLRHMQAIIAVLLFLITCVYTQQDIGDTSCSICNMMVQAVPNQEVQGNQALYACEMAGHFEQLQTHTVSLCVLLYVFRN